MRFINEQCPSKKPLETKAELVIRHSMPNPNLNVMAGCHLDSHTDSDADKFSDLLETFGLIQHVTTPTHSSGHILDLVVTRSCYDLLLQTPRTTLFISDHCFIETAMAFPRPELSIKEICFRQYKKIDIETFQNNILDCKLHHNPPTDLLNLAKTYDKVLTDILDRNAPLLHKTVTVRPMVPWFNPELKALKAKRRKLEKKMLRSQRKSDKDAYREICNKYTKLLHDCKHLYYTEQINRCAGDSRKLFQVVTSLCNKKQECPLPPHNDSETLANDFGDFFCRKIDLLREEIDSIHVVPPQINCYPPEIQLHSFSTVTESVVLAVIMSSSGAFCKQDPIPTWLLKLCIDELLPVITEMVNLSIRGGLVPADWKCALVKPLLKKLDLEPVHNNFRPVSNLSFISKCAEKLVLQQLLSHCSENAPLPSNQSAYRKYHSTETCLLKVQNDILLSTDRQEVTLLVLLDLSAAFDTIDHNLLLNLLQSDFGVIGSALQWVRSFLSERQQRVVVGQSCSKDYQMKYGVPQGSCIGPILFLLYTSRLFKLMEKHLPDMQGYADDTQLYLSFRPPSSEEMDRALSALCAAIAEVRAWLISHKLKFNDTKTEFIIIGTRQQLAKVEIPSVKVGTADIAPLTSIRNLGAWFDDKMSMNDDGTGQCLPHFTPCATPCSSGINIFAQSLPSDHNLYVFPPFVLIALLLRCILEQDFHGAFTIIISDLRPRRFWWELLK